MDPASCFSGLTGAEAGAGEEGGTRAGFVVLAALWGRVMVDITLMRGSERLLRCHDRFAYSGFSSLTVVGGAAPGLTVMGSVLAPSDLCTGNTPRLPLPRAGLSPNSLKHSSQRHESMQPSPAW